MSVESEVKKKGSVELEHHGAVAMLTLTRPDALNAMTWTMYEQLEDHLTALAADKSIRVVVIRGAGDKALAAGTDISQFKDFSGQDGVAYEERINRVMNQLAEFPKPTIAAVHGYAVGGGMIIATACDLRYATCDAKFGAPMARTLGNCLSMDNYKRLAEELGAMRTKELLYTAKVIGTEEAAALGFLTGVFENETFFDQVLETAEKISRNAPMTVDTTKKAMTRIYKGEEQSDHFDEVIAGVYGSEDFKEGVTAYMEKRRPVWQGK
ncbi:enoyl-CoA hydratase [Alteribacter natronophilus]|uniref:enoyl-CoA hydratase n=1 Tax=Alteribacter natronophilus TaxID=2583810 RepID=UPI00110F0B18|nr:enoyl-CoA hydratase [Alteribacter natronophilus]TMW72847.1 enoyl-CoA hydratase [Alteribacter natronophilus]